MEEDYNPIIQELMEENGMEMKEDHNVIVEPKVADKNETRIGGEVQSNAPKISKVKMENKEKTLQYRCRVNNVYLY